MHDLVIVGVPLIAILAGILFSRLDIKDLRRELFGVRDELRSEFRGEFAGVRGEFAAIRGEITALRTEMHHEFERFYMTLGQHDAKIENLQKRSS